MRSLALTAAVLGALGLAASTQAAVIFTENFEDATATADPQWSTSAGTAAFSAAPTPEGNFSFVVGDGLIARIGRAFTTNAAATSVKLTFDVYANSNASSQRYYGQLSNGTATVPGTGTGGFERVAANNDANSHWNFLYSNGATQTVNTLPAITVGWHTISITVTPGAAGVGQYTYQVDNNSAVTITSTGAIVMPTNVQLGQTVSNGSAGAPDTSAWFDNIKVEQFAPAASAASSLLATPDSTSAELSWSGSASKYDVYVGTDAGNLTRVAQGISGTSFDALSLNPETTYFWRVDALNAVGDPTTGTAASFLTTAVPEPASLSLLGVGVLPLLRRRRSR